MTGAWRLRLHLGLLLAFILLLTSLPAAGQGSSGAISGRVIYEHSKEGVSSVPVQLRSFTDMTSNQTITDPTGNFAFRGVGLGTYYVSVRVSGYAEVSERVDVGLTSGFVFLYLRPLPGKEETPAAAAFSAAYLKVPAKAREEYELGMKLYQKENKLAEGLQHLRKAAELHPKFAEAYLGMGMLLMDLDRLEEARDSLLRAIEENEKMVPAYFPLGAIFNQRREFSDAEKILRRGIGVKEDIWQLHFELARAIGYQSRWEEAEKNARRAAELNATAPKVRLLLANIYFELGKDDLALAEAEEFLKLAPDDPIAPQIRTQVEAMRKAKSPPTNPL